MIPGMRLAWDRLERALSLLEHPEARLAPPATETDLAALEEQVGCALPEEVRSLWGGHNGEQPAGAGLAGGFRFIAVQEAKKVSADWEEVRRRLGGELKSLDRATSSQPAKAIQRKYSLRGWIAMLRDDEGNYIGVDLDPGPAGTRGQVINFGRDEDDKRVLFPTVVELVEWLAGELEARRIVYDKADKRVLHVGGRLVAVVP